MTGADRVGPDTTDLVLLAGLGVLWGGAVVAIKVAVDDIPPFTQVALRTLMAAALLYGVLRWRGLTLPRSAYLWWRFTVLGLLGATIPFTLNAFGETRVDAALAAILLGSMPLFTIVLAHLFTSDEPMTWRRAAGVLLGFAGVLALLAPDAISGRGGDVIGQLAVIGAAVSYAGAAVYAYRLREVPVPVLSVAHLICATAIAWPLALVIDRPWTLTPAADAVIALALLGLVMTGVAALMFYRLLASAGATFASQVNYLVPAFGAIGGAVLLGETLEVHTLVALALILAGVAAVRAATRRRSDA